MKHSLTAVSCNFKMKKVAKVSLKVNYQRKTSLFCGKDLLPEIF